MQRIHKQLFYVIIRGFARKTFMS